jgi:hypothetical protein
VFLLIDGKLAIDARTGGSSSGMPPGSIFLYRIDQGGER